MSLDYTDASGNQWSIDNDGQLQSAIRPYASGTGTSKADAVDSASLLSTVVAGIGYQGYYSWGAATTGANTQTVTGVNASQGISITRDVYVGNGFVRYLEIVTNTGTAAKTVGLTIGDDIYYDTSTVMVGTSSGDTALTTADDWYAAGSGSNPLLPKVVHVFSCDSNSPGSVALPSADRPAATFSIDLGAGETRAIMHFYALAGDTASATVWGNALAGLADSSYLAGMTSTERAQLANFTLDVSSASTKTLLAYQQNLTLTGAAAINGTGNANNNIITGNAGINTLTGNDGNDTIFGGAGNDILIGGAGNDSLNGGIGNDQLKGGAGNDIYVVDSAGDTVTEKANEGIDTIISGINYDLSLTPYLENITLTGTASNATGNMADNVLIGNASANRLSGGAGNDFLDGGAGIDALTGGLGDDVYVVDNGGDTVLEGASAGSDTVMAALTYSINTVAGANIENIGLTGSALGATGNGLNNLLQGNASANTLIGLAGNDTLDGGAGVDTMTGGKGDDVYHVDSALDRVVESTAEGTDKVISSVNFALGANVENLQLSGQAFKATGNALNNNIVGNAGDNVIDGGAGADKMAGGAGSDTYVVDNALDVVTEAIGAGVDTVQSKLTNFTLSASIENGVLLAGAVSLSGNTSNNDIRGNGLANTLSGNEGNDILNGGGGNDTLLGGAGDDILIGDNSAPDMQLASAEATVGGKTLALNLSAPAAGTGAVSVSGTISNLGLEQSALNVVYIIDHSGSMSSAFSGTVAIGDRNGDGSDNTTMDAAIASFEKLNSSLIQSGVGSQIKVGLVAFDSSSNLAYSGAPAFDGDGNGVVDIVDQLRVLTPGGSTNYTDALTSASDYLATLGSGKNVVFFVSDGAPDNQDYLNTVLPALRAMGQGGTTIRAIGTGAGADEAVLDILDDGIANHSATIVMNPEDLDAGLINTSLLGLGDGAWIEIYNNGTMVDLIGADQFTVGPLGLQFQSAKFALSSSGTDMITAKLMAADGTVITTVLPIDVKPSISNDSLVGGDGNDTLDGGYGADTMVGGLGNDTYTLDHVADVVSESTGEGIDRVVAKISIAALAANVENLDLVGVSAIRGAGNNLNNVITGNVLDNFLSGLDGNDSLMGGAGNDTLNGGAGNDSMIGGDGSDMYYVDSYFDVVTELRDAAGSDAVISAFNSGLGGYVTGISTQKYFNYIENLTLASGSSATIGIGDDANNNYLTGNENSNVLYGLGGNDTLDGGAAADTLDGGAGNDIYHIDNIGDIIVDAAGVDTVISKLSAYVLGSGLENLQLAAQNGVLNGTGNSLANTLTGNAYNNILNGGTGADVMYGAAGNDTYTVDNAFDRVIEAVNAGIDQVNSAVGFKLGANIEKLLLTGVAHIGGAGNDLSNTLTGNTGNNRLLAYAGNDSIAGGAGNDALIGGLGADTLTGGAGNDIFRFNNVTELGDTITDFAAGDKFEFYAPSFKNLAAGTLAASNFATNAAVDGNDYFVFNGSTHKLYYDADGSGAQAAVVIATVGTATLTAADIFMSNAL